jgi:YVTN family beta-propeller protein
MSRDTTSVLLRTTGLALTLLSVMLILLGPTQDEAEAVGGADEFTGASLDSGFWDTSQLTSGMRWCQAPDPDEWRPVYTTPCGGYIQPTTFGNVSVTGGEGIFSNGNSRTFPYAWSQNGIFPASGDFMVEVRMKYDSISSHGDGFHVRRWTNATPSTDNTPYAGGADYCASASIWADSVISLRARLLTREVAIGNPTGYHTYHFEYVSGKYLLFVDGVLRVGPISSVQRADRVWAGNPVFTHWGANQWTDFRLDYVRITQPASFDVDADTVPDAVEAPVNVPLALQTDIDQDGLPDGCDPVKGSNSEFPIITTKMFGTPVTGIGVNPNTNRLFVALGAQNRVAVMDGLSNAIVDTDGNPGNGITYLTASIPRRVVVNPNANRIFVENSNAVSVIDGATLTELDTDGNSANGKTRLAVGGPPRGLALNVATNRLYVMVTTPGVQVRIYDATTFAEIDADGNALNGMTRIALSQISGSDRELTVDEERNRIYVSNPGFDNVAVIDGATNTEIDTDGNSGNGVTRISLGDAPAWMAMDSNADRLYVTNRGSDTVSVINVLSNTEIDIDGNAGNGVTRVAVGDNPTSAAIDCNRLFSANNGAGNLSVHNTATYTADAIVWTGPGGAAGSDIVAINPNTHRVYTSSHRNRSLHVIQAPSCTPPPPGDLEWLRQFGTSGTDFATGVSVNSSSVYSAGRTDGGLNGQSSSGGSDVYVTKHDTNGNHIWTRQFGSAVDDLAFGVAADSSGVYLTGQTNGTLPGETPVGASDAWVSKYDANGNHLWTTQFGSSNFDSATNVAVDSSGVYVVGRTAGTFPGGTNAGGEDIFIQKVDSAGNLVWARQFGSSSSEAGEDVALDGSAVYIAGRTSGTLPGQTSAGGQDAFMRKYDRNGTEAWTRQFGTSASDEGYAASAGPAGIYLGGVTLGTLPSQTSAGGQDGFLRRYDSSGTEIWTRQFGSSGADVVFAASQRGSSVYAAGFTNGTLPGETSAGSNDAFARRYDSNGNAIWTTQFGSSASDATLGAYADPGVLYLAGQTDGSMPQQVSSGTTDIWVAKIGTGQVVEPPTGTWAAVSAGEYHTCGITTAQLGVWCWGDNPSGNLGNGTTNDSSIPVPVTGLSSGVVEIVSGAYYSCARTSTGAVKCWGENGDGTLGNGTNTDSSVPVDVSGLSSGVIALAGGGTHVCALTNAGAVKCWGENLSGQLGNAGNSDSNTPVQASGLTTGITAIGTGSDHSCAVTSGGALKCWGHNGQGQLGNGSNTNSNVPVDVTGLSSGISTVDGGHSHSCALTSGGAVKCWGSNNPGQLGDGTATDSNVPVNASGLSSGVSAVSLGGSHTCALTTGGGLKCWGANSQRQLGVGDNSPRTTPTDVLGLTSGVYSVSGGGLHTCAVMSTGVTKCWGNNGFGQLGDGTTTSPGDKVDVVDPPEPGGLIVTNTNDSGAGSLRSAILTANALPNGSEPDEITFAISGAGPHTITPLSELPTITDPVFINGYSQLGSSANTNGPSQGTNAVLKIVLDGNGLSAHGLQITAGNSEVRGLVINDFAYDRMYITSGGNNVIAGNFIGTDVTGSVDQSLASNNYAGIHIQQSPNNLVGGLNAADRNVVSGNNNNVAIEGSAVGNTASGNVVQGNLVGINAAGTAGLGCCGKGVVLSNAFDSQVGGLEAGARNVLSGNNNSALLIVNSQACGNVVQGNYIGTDVTGTSNVGNNNAGVDIAYVACVNTIGGFEDGAANTIAFNGRDGVLIEGTATRQALYANSIFSNVEQGIDLMAPGPYAASGDGVTLNDDSTFPYDTDSGGNNRQNFPLITSAGTLGATTTIVATLKSTEDRSYRIDFFSNPTCDAGGYGEGRVYLGSANLVTKPQSDPMEGIGEVTVGGLPAVTPGQVITATATREDTGDTSEFSACTTVTSTARVVVNKDFADDNPAAVSIALACTSGAISIDDASAAETDEAEFTIGGFTTGATCTATETVPSGYTADESNCLNVAIAVNVTSTCTITNDKGLLLIQTSEPWWPQSGCASNVSALNELNVPHTMISHAQLATTDLSQFKVVMTASNQSASYYQAFVSNASQLDAFVSGGGVLIAHVADNISTSYTWLPGGTQSVDMLSNALTITDAANPIVAGLPGGGPVTDAGLDGWSQSTHGYFTSLPSGATKVFGVTGDAAGKPVYVTYDLGSGHVLATEQPIEARWCMNPGQAAARNVLKNEILYAEQLGSGAPPAEPAAVKSSTGSISDATGGTVPEASAVDPVDPAVNIPAGALPGSVTDITVTVSQFSATDPALPPPPPGSLPSVYKFEPEGQTFDADIEIILPYQDADSDGLEDTTGVAEDLIQVNLFVSGNYTTVASCTGSAPPVPDPCVLARNTEGNNITVISRHFSLYALRSTGAVSPDTDGDGVPDAVDNCVSAANGPSGTEPGQEGQENFDGDALGDVCDADDDNDKVQDVAEPPCGGNVLNAAIRPERVDGIFDNVDDDGDTQVDEALPGGSSDFDCDGDGYKGSAEDHVFSYLPGPPTDGDQKTCQEYDATFPNGAAHIRPSKRWPADLASGAFSGNKINIQDLSSFTTPVRYIGQPVGTDPDDVRFDLSLAAPAGINIVDMAALTSGATAFPPMLGGVRAFGGPVCPYAP